jgi:hypothetical protein
MPPYKDDFLGKTGCVQALKNMILQNSSIFAILLRTDTKMVTNYLGKPLLTGIFSIVFIGFFKQACWLVVGSRRGQRCILAGSPVFFRHGGPGREHHQNNLHHQ